MADQAAEFRRLADELWGYGSLSRAARYFEVSDRTARHWAAGRNAVPDRVMDELRAMVSIAPPPQTTDDDDRDDACAEAIEPALTELRDRAVAAGWHHAEFATALFALAASEIRDLAGNDGLRHMLDQACAQIGDDPA